jgi:hypothetical protein
MLKLFYDGVGGAELKKLEWNSSKHVDNMELQRQRLLILERRRLLILENFLSRV